MHTGQSQIALYAVMPQKELKQLHRTRNWIAFALMTVLLIGILAGCGARNKAEGSIPIGDTLDLSAVAGVQTDFGTLFVPEQYLPAMKSDIKMEDDGCVVRFSTEQDGKSFDLYSIAIGVESGEYVGELTDDSGVKRAVYVELFELDMDGRSPEQQDQLYALQESVNAVIENLK